MSKFPETIFPIPEKDSFQLFEFYNKNFPESQWTQEHWNEILMSDKKNILIGLKEKNAYIGFIFGKIIGKHVLSASIDALAVDSKYRRNGYGSFLMKKFLEVAFNHFLAKKIKLHFRDSNESRLIKFYTTLGFRNHHITGAYSNGEAKHCLEIEKTDFLAL